MRAKERFTGAFALLRSGLRCLAYAPHQAHSLETLPIRFSSSVILQIPLLLSRSMCPFYDFLHPN